MSKNKKEKQPAVETAEAVEAGMAAEEAAAADTQAEGASDGQAEAASQPEPESYTLTAEEFKTVQEHIQTLQKQKDETVALLQRNQADFDNFRKRTIKEKADLILTGGEKVLSALLPVLDDLERARDNMQKATDVESLREGVEMIIGKLDKTLAAQGLKRMEPIGTLFDTDFHEAIAMVPGMGDDKKGKVIDCVQTGYKLNDKVIRHAKVAVGQ